MVRGDRFIKNLNLDHFPAIERTVQDEINRLGRTIDWNL